MAPTSTTHSASLKPLTLLVSALALIHGQLPCAIPQATTNPGDSAGCSGRMVLLAPCGPFVQGMADSPSLGCCDNLIDLYRDQRSCLCLLLNQSSSLPINHTLALQLPSLCNLTAHASACSQDGSPQTVHGSSNANSSAATVENALPPRSGSALLFGIKSGGKMRVEASPVVMFAMFLVLA